MPYSLLNSKVTEKVAMGMPLFVPSVELIMHHMAEAADDASIYFAWYGGDRDFPPRPDPDSPYEFDPNVRTVCAFFGGALAGPHRTAQCKAVLASLLALAPCVDRNRRLANAAVWGVAGH